MCVSDSKRTVFRYFFDKTCIKIENTVQNVAKDYIWTVFFMSLNNVRTKFRRWELALLIGLSLTLLFCLWLEREQSELSESVLRLHVLANSDSDADQNLKLKVRDRILDEAGFILPDNASIDEATDLLTQNLEQLAEAGAQVVAKEGYNYKVKAEICETWFPTKNYDGFSMPAGQYRALRIVIGEGEGQNWWCVVFPPLCVGTASESIHAIAVDAGLDEKQVALLVGEKEGYVVKFKVLELWEKIKILLE